METANQLYRNSQSPLPFKEWLKREQIKGKLKINEKEYINANGDEEVENETEVEVEDCPPPPKDNSAMKFLFGLTLGIGATLLVQRLLKK
jgi:hypothetical protein